MEYIVTVERHKTLWLCLGDSGEIRKLNYMMAAMSFVGGNLHVTKELVLGYHPRFIVAPRSVTTVYSYVMPMTRSILIIDGVKQNVIALDRNILLLPHLDFKKVLKSTLDCI